MFYRYTLLATLFFMPTVCLAATEGPNSPDSGNITSDSSNGGTTSWATPGNASANDGVETESDVDDLATSHYLNAQNFGFSIPDGATIDGIFAEIEAALGTSTQCRGSALDTAVYLLKGGSVVGDNKATNTQPNSAADTYESYGGSSDLWGTTWSASEVNASDFGVVFAYTEQDDDNCDVEVDHIRITVTYTEAVPVPDLHEWAVILLVIGGVYYLYREGALDGMINPYNEV